MPYFLCYTPRMKMKIFQKTILDYYRTHGRKFPWRQTHNPYKILVSEVMLQQTQADRVVPKFNAFIKKFRTVEALAHASQKDVLVLWSGLGYNRRALNLHRAAKAIVLDHAGKVPKAKEALVALPAIGPYTAGAIRAFAFNEPDNFIETNIRSVYIHFFFADRKTKITDKELLAVGENVMYLENPCEWYQALMDYGAMLKREGKGYLNKTRNYTKQSKFQGSDRKIRGAILKLLLQKSETLEGLVTQINENKARITKIITGLSRDGFIKIKSNRFFMKS